MRQGGLPGRDFEERDGSERLGRGRLLDGLDERREHGVRQGP